MLIIRTGYFRTTAPEMFKGYDPGPFWRKNPTKNFWGNFVISLTLVFQLLANISVMLVQLPYEFVSLLVLTWNVIWPYDAQDYKKEYFRRSHKNFGQFTLATISGQ